MFADRVGTNFNQAIWRILSNFFLLKVVYYFFQTLFLHKTQVSADLYKIVIKGQCAGRGLSAILANVVLFKILICELSAEQFHQINTNN